MKKITLFKCEICGVQYADEQKAVECEASHKDIIKIESAKYRSKNSNPYGYPDTVTLKFVDDKLITYRR